VTTAPHRYAVGDRVIIDPDHATATTRGVVYVVTELLKVNLRMQPVGGGRAVRANPSLLLPAPPDGSPATVGVPYVPPLTKGTVVTVAGPGWTQPAGELYVVLNESAAGKVSFAKLGGDPGGRYWAGIPRRAVTPVTGRPAVLTGISAEFSSQDLEALVRTAGDAACADKADLSAHQRGLAARAYQLNQADALDDNPDD